MRSTLLLCILALFCAGVMSDTCLSFPPSLGAGANCGGAVPCAYGLYCDKSAVCSQKLEANKPCSALNSDECVETSSCKGTTGALLCVANANPGEPCSAGNSDSVPYCGTGYCTAGVCTQGKHGDSCLQNSDCLTNLTCTSSICKALPDGSFCVSSAQCMPGSGCVLNVCVKQATAGDCTTSSAICGYGSTCVYNPIANTTTCISTTTLNAGDYCGGSSNGYLCKDTQRCVNGHCAPGRIGPCSGQACSFDESCNCGGIGNGGGYGQCQKNPCLDKLGKYTNCIYTKCGSSGYDGSNYAKSCLNLNCANEYKEYTVCSGSSILTVSFFLVSFFAILSSFSKF